MTSFKHRSGKFKIAYGHGRGSKRFNLYGRKREENGRDRVRKSRVVKGGSTSIQKGKATFHRGQGKYWDWP